jgi:hypothetical protein
MMAVLLALSTQPSCSTGTTARHETRTVVVDETTTTADAGKNTKPVSVDPDTMTSPTFEVSEQLAVKCKSAGLFERIVCHDGRYIALDNEKNVYEVSASGCTFLASIQTEMVITDFDMAGEGRMVIAGFQDGKDGAPLPSIRFVDTGDWMEIQSLASITRLVSRVEYSETDGRLYYLASGGTLHVIDSAGDHVIMEKVISFSLSDSGEYLGVTHCGDPSCGVDRRVSISRTDSISFESIREGFQGMIAGIRDDGQVVLYGNTQCACMSCHDEGDLFWGTSGVWHEAHFSMLCGVYYACGTIIVEQYHDSKRSMLRFLR